MKKYIVILEESISGRIVVIANNKKEALKIGEEVLSDSVIPEWWETGTTLVEKCDEIKTNKDREMVKKQMLKEYGVKK